MKFKTLIATICAVSFFASGALAFLDDTPRTAKTDFCDRFAYVMAEDQFMPFQLSVPQWIFRATADSLALNQYLDCNKEGKLAPACFKTKKFLARNPESTEIRRAYYREKARLGVNEFHAMNEYCRPRIKQLFFIK